MIRDIHLRWHCLVEGLRNEQVTARSAYATRRAVQRDGRRGTSGRLGERAHPEHPTGVGVRLHSMGLSLQEIVAVVEWLDVDRSHGAVWNWTHKLSRPITRSVGCSASPVRTGPTRRPASGWSVGRRRRVRSLAAVVDDYGRPSLPCGAPVDLGRAIPGRGRSAARRVHVLRDGSRHPLAPAQRQREGLLNGVFSAGAAVTPPTTARVRFRRDGARRTTATGGGMIDGTTEKRRGVLTSTQLTGRGCGRCGSGRR